MMMKIIPKEDAWLMRHKVMWPEKGLDYVKLDDDEIGTHYGLFEGEELVSVVSLFIDGEEAQFRKFATLEAQQNKGYGTQLLNGMLREAKQAGVRRIFCNARVAKALFYKKFGFKETDTTFTKGGKDYIVMERWFHGEETKHHDAKAIL